MSNYRRTSKPKTEHIKKGFTVFQKTVATIASILGLITASITIMNALDNNKNIKKEPTTIQTTTIVKEIQKESPKENTSPTKETNTSQEKTQQEETPKSSVKEEKKEDQKTATQDSSTPASSKPATENEKQSNAPTSENKSNQ
ncbi:membrane protein [Streptococcus pneumoniae]|nr:membrane protein [Streptococcus pneumoniae]VSU98390.1 membrane protein [Streptococcus pneumoniae]